jgi:protein-L-isoaspartate(D-aspartate) O-methyltransferase
MQVGAATGYYSAVLAEIVGHDGWVTAVEYEANLAARARDNLKPWRHVEVVEGDGTTHDAGEVDAVIVCAGATHPAPLWLDRLAEGGRLVMPLTAAGGWGFVLRVVRRGGQFHAASIGGVGIFDCVGVRDEEAAKRLQVVVNDLRGNPAPIGALHRGEPPIDATDQVWYHGPGFWLQREPAVTTDITAT